MIACCGLHSLFFLLDKTVGEYIFKDNMNELQLKFRKAKAFYQGFNFVYCIKKY
jgi:hypothetical protein